MIFSRYKKPTEPGRYWARLKNEPFTVVVDFDDDEPEELVILTTYADSVNTTTVKISYCSFEWGDRIETPTVEAP